MAITESRQQQLLAGQSSIAQKIFRFVPIQESWSANDIQASAIAANATAVSAPAIRRALGELKDAGIIREPSNGKFQRDAVTTKQKSESVMPKAANQAIVSVKKPEVQALDALAGLSAEVVSLADEVGARLKAMAARIEEVALSVEAEREGNAQASAKLKQLQSLLKEIGGAA
ncbi:hypothetical protein [Pseudomonas sp.]|uniref:hypothetical protein n=1 Tax=Pseudomonas sp. TaxID=306 RepID=UPI002583CF82|nr:hypothetical protein [Pseudomonas sp.]